MFAFWRILKATKRSFLHLYTNALSSSNSVSRHICGQIQDFLEDCPLCPNVELPLTTQTQHTSANWFLYLTQDIDVTTRNLLSRLDATEIFGRGPLGSL